MTVTATSKTWAGLPAFFFIQLILLFSISLSAYSKTIIVDKHATCILGYCFGACKSGDYTTKTISDALYHADDGDVIEICPGTYKEGSLVVGKDNLTIRGLGSSSDDVEVKYEDTGSVFYLQRETDNITLQNIYIYQKNSSSSSAALYSPFTENLTLKNVRVKSKSYGIVLTKTRNVRIEGLYLYSYKIGFASGSLLGRNFILSSQIKSKKESALNIGTVEYLNVSSTSLEASRSDCVWIENVNNSLDFTNDFFGKARYENVAINNLYGTINIDSCVFEDGRNYGLYIRNASKGGYITNSVFTGSREAELFLLNKKKSVGFNIEYNCFEKDKGYNVVNRDEKAVFRSNYYNDYSGSGSYEIPVIPIYDPQPQKECGIDVLPVPIASWRMDECSWNGSRGEVKDSVGNYSGRSVNSKISQGFTCNGGDLTGGGYIELDNMPSLSRYWTFSAWIKFPLVPSKNQYQSNGRYYFVVASIGGTGDLGFFAKDKYGSYYFGVYDSSGERKEKKIGVIKDGWHMVTIVGKSGETYLYIDGNEICSIGIATHGELEVIGSSTDFSGRESLNTDIDEVLLFNQKLSSKKIKTIYQNESGHKNYNGTERQCTTCMSIDHYEIIHPQVGFTCEPSTIVIRACSDRACSKLYTGSVTLTLNWDGQSEQVSFSGGEGEAKVSYSQTGSIALSITNPVPSPQNPYVCIVQGTSSTSCKMDFEDAGFVFKSPNESRTVVDNTTSCTDTPVEIYAVVEDNSTHTCSTPKLNGNVQLYMHAEYINPNTNPYGSKVVVNGTAINTSSSATAVGTPVVVAFRNGVGSFELNYPDAGAIKLFAEFKGAFSLKGSTNVFVVKPYKFALKVNESNPASKSVCSNDYCYSNIGVFTEAGKPFNLTISAECRDGTITKNFKDSIELKAVMVAPDNGTDDSSYLSNRGTSLFKEGRAVVEERFNDVGVINLIATDKNYLGSGSINGSIKLGRFIPDYFYVEPFTGSFKNMCTTFNYMRQPIIGYAKRPYFEVIAKSVDNTTTPHYKGYFFKLSKGDIGVEPPQNNSNAPYTFNFTQGNQEFLKESGVGVYKFDNDTVVFNSSEPIPPFTPLLHYTVNSVEDKDGVSCKNCPVDVDITGSPVKYGKIKIYDNFGTTTLPLTLNIRTLYWNGSMWETNTDDICTELKKPYFTLSHYTGKLKPGETEITGVGGINSGSGFVTLSAPGLGNHGSVRVDINNAPFCSWLCTPDTFGTAFFGMYRGNDRLLEWKVIKPR